MEQDGDAEAHGGEERNVDPGEVAHAGDAASGSLPERPPGLEHGAGDMAPTPQQLFEWQQTLWHQQQMALAQAMMWQGVAMQGWMVGGGRDNWQAYDSPKGKGRNKRGGQGSAGFAAQDAQDGETHEQRDACEALVRRMNEGDRGAVHEAMEMMRGKVFEFSKRKYACRMVQKVIAESSFPQQKEIVGGFHGRVMRAVTHMHANFVVQKFIEKCPQSVVAFVAAEMHGHAASTARQRSACRVIIHLLDGTYGQETVTLIDELLGHEHVTLEPENELGKLLMHEYAHHVIAKVLERGEPHHRKLVMECFKNDLWTFAKDSRSCYVLEFAVGADIEFSEGADEDVQRVQHEMLEMLVDKKRTAGENNHVCPLIADMAANQYGSYVVRALLNRQDEFAKQAADRLCENIRSLKGGKPGQRIIKEMQSLGLRSKDP